MSFSIYYSHPFRVLKICPERFSCMRTFDSYNYKASNKIQCFQGLLAGKWVTELSEQVRIRWPFCAPVKNILVWKVLCLFLFEIRKSNFHTRIFLTSVQYFASIGGIPDRRKHFEAISVVSSSHSDSSLSRLSMQSGNECLWALNHTCDSCLSRTLRCTHSIA